MQTREPQLAMGFSSTTKAPTPEHVSDHDDAYGFDDEDDYLFQTYAPLSCFPTPPPSCHTSSPREPARDFTSDSSLDASLLGTHHALPPLPTAANQTAPGPATYLSNLIPCSASLLSPSPPLAHSLLSRARLPPDTLALAACMLDSLTPRFAATWRRSLPLPPSASRHIDRVRPEVIIVGALLASYKFLDDGALLMSTYADDIGEGRWTCAQINVTERCILENLGWRVVPLWREELIGGAKEDMRRAGTVVRRRRESAAKTVAGRRVGEGAVWTAEGQLTPVEGVVGENLAC